jgi:hypothetical protein
MLEPPQELNSATSDVIVELKAAERVLPIHRAQLLSYLKTTGCRLGLLIDFHEVLLTNGIRRVVLTKSIRQQQPWSPISTELDE